MDQFAKETLPVSLEEEMRRSYLDYAMSVIVGRALPDVRDGLKPVHRRVLFAMHEANNVWNRPYVKCARVVGDVLGKYHPHGDTATYEALVRMAQDFSHALHADRRAGQFRLGRRRLRRLPIATPNAGWTRITPRLLADIDKETVDFVPNYDGKEQEPIGPADARSRTCWSTARRASRSAWRPTSRRTTWPRSSTPAWRCSTNPDIGIEELIEIVPAPDFPTAGIIYGTRGRAGGLPHRARHAW